MPRHKDITIDDGIHGLLSGTIAGSSDYAAGIVRDGDFPLGRAVSNTDIGRAFMRLDTGAWMGLYSVAPLLWWQLGGGSAGAFEHGDLPGGTLHAPATSTVNGFYSSSDKVANDAHRTSTGNPHTTTAAQVGAIATAVAMAVTGTPTNGQVLTATAGGAATWQTPATGGVSTARIVASGAGLTGGGDLSADRTLAVGANADGSIVVNADDVGVGVLATDAQHGVRGGGTQHANATTSVAGFMSSADKVKLDGLGAGVSLASTVPAAVGTAAIGVGTTAARADHVHAHGDQLGGSLHALVVAGGAAGFISGGDKTKLDGIAAGATNTPFASTAGAAVSASAGTVGVGTTAARADHTHQVTTGSPVAVGVGAANFDGVLNSLARADHVHSLPLVTTSVPGAMSAADKTKLDGISPGAGSGVALSVLAPADVGSINSVGVGTSAARSDHVHNHGNQVGGSFHALVTTSVAGFMSAADKVKLDGLGASVSLSSATPSPVGTAAAGVATAAARGDHVHAHGDQAGGTLHANGTTSVAGFLSATDKTKLDGIATGATALALSSTAPSPVGTAVIGSGLTAARHDHVHAHGDQAGGSLHANATTSVAGFMSAADKTNHDVHIANTSNPHATTAAQVGAVASPSGAMSLSGVPTAGLVPVASSGTAAGWATLGSASEGHAGASGLTGTFTLNKATHGKSIEISVAGALTLAYTGYSAGDTIILSVYVESGSGHSLSFSGPWYGLSKYSDIGMIVGHQCLFVIKMTGVVPSIVASSGWWSVSDAKGQAHTSYGYLINQLSALTSPHLLRVVFCIGGTSAGDGLQGLYYWSPTTVGTADGFNFVTGATGQYVRFGGLSTGTTVGTTRTISTTAPLTGGGDLSANRTIAISAASGSAAGSMSSADFTKLTSIEAGAQVTSFARVQTALQAGTSGTHLNNQRLYGLAGVEFTEAAVAFSSAMSIDIAARSLHRPSTTLTSNFTIDLTNVVVGQVGRIIVQQDGTGGRVMTAMTYAAGAVPVFSAVGSVPLINPAAGSMTVLYYHVWVNGIAVHSSYTASSSWTASPSQVGFLTAGSSPLFARGDHSHSFADMQNDLDGNGYKISDLGLLVRRPTSLANVAGVVTLNTATHQSHVHTMTANAAVVIGGSLYYQTEGKLEVKQAAAGGYQITGFTCTLPGSPTIRYARGRGQPPFIDPMPDSVTVITYRVLVASNEVLISSSYYDAGAKITKAIAYASPFTLDFRDCDTIVMQTTGGLPTMNSLLLPPDGEWREFMLINETASPLYWTWGIASNWAYMQRRDNENGAIFNLAVAAGRVGIWRMRPYQSGVMIDKEGEWRSPVEPPGG